VGLASIPCWRRGGSGERGKLVGEKQRGMRSKSGGLATNCKGSVRNGCGYPMVFIVSRVVWF
jgi:hypothetical protein